MLKEKLYNYSLSIVILGDFNPIMIQPFWLSSKGLIRETEAESAKIEIIHNEVVKFEIDWLSVDVNRRRLELKTNKDMYFEPLKDLCISLLKIMNDFPVNSFGINHICEYNLNDKETYYNFGNKLAPLNNWKDSMKNPRLLSLEIIENERKDEKDGHLRVRINPSTHYSKLKYGIIIDVNDHYAISKESIKNNATKIVEILNSDWKESKKRNEELTEKIWEKTK